jgi:hypothetical protein
VIDRRQLLLPLAACALAGPAAVAAARPRAPRTRWGRPSFEGVWTNATYTELERPQELKSLVVTPEAARAWEARLVKTGGVNVPEDPLGQAQSEFPESGSGLMRVRGEIRGSIIVDPPDGQIPYSKAGKAAVGIEPRRRRGYDDPEARPQNERCLTAEGAGAPILPAADTNVLQIVQTPDFIVLHSEKYHDARIVRMSGARGGRLSGSWLGESRGRWDGDTLVVETDHLRDGYTMRADGFYVSSSTRVEERFTRTGPGEIAYSFTVSDPALFSQAWRGELVFTPSRGRIYEYACHEGNYSLINILGAARLGRQPAPAAAPPSP